MNKLQTEQTRLTTISLLIIAAVALGFAIKYASIVLIPFVLAVFITLLVSPILDFQVLRLKIPRPLAVFVTILIVLIILSILFIFAGHTAQTFITTAGQYSDSIINMIDKSFLKLNEWGLDLDQGQIGQDLKNNIPAFVTSSVGSIMGVVSKALSVAIFVLFLLIGRNPNAIYEGMYGEIDRKIRRYISIKTVVSVITGLLVWIVLVLFKLELAAVFGICAFLLNFIPSIGSIIATMLPIPVAFAQFDNPWIIGTVILVPGAIQMTIGNIIEPKLMGQSLHLHPVTILLALSFWGLLWGIPGMFLAVPITAVIRIILMQFDTLRPIGQLMAGQLPKWETQLADTNE
ncbi:MAG: AI-2E family transporter [Planctomycetota bacterium]|jgi:AI-2 transport protein TqsA